MEKKIDLVIRNAKYYAFWTI